AAISQRRCASRRACSALNVTPHQGSPSGPALTASWDRTREMTSSLACPFERIVTICGMNKRRPARYRPRVDGMSYCEQSSCERRKLSREEFVLHDTIVLELHTCLRSRYKRSGLRGVVACKNLELAAKRGALQNIEKSLDCRKTGRLFSQDEIVALAVQGN